MNLYKHYVNNNLIAKNHSGFRPGDSVTNPLLYLVHEMHRSIDSIENTEVRSVYFDMSKAFDKNICLNICLKLLMKGSSIN